jgi:hypothetical protein
MESQPQLDPVKSAILQILAREPKFEASQYLLWQALPGFGVQASADDVVEALAWLESQGLIRVDRLHEIVLARITDPTLHSTLHRPFRPLAATA